jgi:hypothetical protein
MDEQMLERSSQDSPAASVENRTATTDYAPLSFPFTVDAEGCTVRFGIEQKSYQLASTHENYNALYSLLLACFANGNKVQLEYRLPIAGIPEPEFPIYSIISAKAMLAGM